MNQRPLAPLPALIVFTLALQALTGVLLMTVYAPAVTTAWASVWHIQAQTPAGWFVRGLHRAATDALIVLLLLYLAVQVWLRGYAGAARRHWWAGLALLALVLAAALTGYLLPWDQWGYWGTTVRTNILGRTPLVGEPLRRALLGGDAIGQLTLTRFFTLHIAILPPLLWMCLRWRSGRRDPCPPTKHEPSVPGKWHEKSTGSLVRTATLCAAWLLALSAWTWSAHSWSNALALDAPADPTAYDYPARPEWWARWLFQLLKYCEGPLLEVVGSVVVPGLIAGWLILLPLAPRLLGRRWTHRMVLAGCAVLGAGVILLSAASWHADRAPAEAAVVAVRAQHRAGTALNDSQQAVLRAAEFHAAHRFARHVARRAADLAQDQGVPPHGPLALLHADPLIQGPRLFAAHCASCHRYDGHDGRGWVPLDAATSSDLAGFATAEWIRALLRNPMDDRFFGLMHKEDGTPAHTRMDRWTREQRERAEDDAAIRQLEADFDAVALYLADESLRPGRLAAVTANQHSATNPPETDSANDMASIDPRVLRGRHIFLTACNQCHGYDGQRSGTFRAPDFLGYGSVAWLERMIADPGDEHCYRRQGREPAQMPAFRDRLTEEERYLIARWLHESRATPGSLP